jgi:hypothetical protein
MASRFGRGAWAAAEGWPFCRDAGVSRCDQRKRVLKKQTCKRWLCSAAMSGIGILPRLFSPSEVMAAVYKHETCIAGVVVWIALLHLFKAIGNRRVTNMTRAPVSPQIYANARTAA